MSRPTRVLISGASGQVGVDLVSWLSATPPPGADATFNPDGRAVLPGEFEVLGLSRHELDVTDAASVRRGLAMARPDVVVHLAAYTAVDQAERDAAQCLLVNDVGTGLMSAASASVGAHFVFVSTDYVFDGEKGDAYDERDEPRPINVYGASKWAGEQRCGPGDTIVRTSWVMGVRGRSVVHVIADRARSGSTVRFVTDQMGTVTLAADLARALVTVARERPSGIWHVANDGATTWFELARFVGHCVGRGEDFVEAITTDQLVPAPLATRPRRSDLDTATWRSRWDGLPAWRVGVERLVHERNS